LEYRLTAVELFNVAGVQDGVPYAEYGLVIEPGQTIEFTLQFLSRQSGRMAVPAAVVALGERGSVAEITPDGPSVPGR